MHTILGLGKAHESTNNLEAEMAALLWVKYEMPFGRVIGKKAGSASACIAKF